MNQFWLGLAILLGSAIAVLSAKRWPASTWPVYLYLLALALMVGVYGAYGFASNYPRSLANVLVSEGGYSNDRHDPGGVTLNGVIQVRYDEYRRDKGLARKPLTRAMERTPEWQAERAEIYKLYYADKIAFEALPAGVDYMIFDYSVNSGYGRGGKILRRVLGLPDTTWRVTPDVIAEVHRRDAKVLIRAISDERLNFLRHLSTFRYFGPGWTRRVVSVRTISLLMADQAQGVVTRRGAGATIRPAYGPGKAFDDDHAEEPIP